MKSAARGCISIYSKTVCVKLISFLEKQLDIEATTTTATTTQRPRPTVVTSEDGKRKILLSLMDVYHCPTRGVFPIDGDCERFLMCRRAGEGDRIKGKVYRCPKGDHITLLFVDNLTSL